MTSTIQNGEEAISPPLMDVSLAANAGALFAGQAVGLIVPLLTIPYLARTLGPGAWGPVIAAQALGNWLLLLVEFGFELSGTRAIARARNAPEVMSDVVHGVQSAKIVLSIGAGALALCAYLAFPRLHLPPDLVAWAVAFAILRGASPLWFFQGVERIRAAVAIDAGTKALAALGVFVLVRGPESAARVIILQAVFALIALVILTIWMSRAARLRTPSVRAALRTLSEGKYLFACRASSGLYIQANTLILSALALPAAVGLFGGAERIVRAAINLLQPLTQAFLPRISFLQSSDTESAHRTVRASLLGVGLLGLLFSLCAIIGAPLLVRVLLGPQYGDAVPVLRMLGALPFLVAVTTVLGLYWAVPFGHEKAFLWAIIAAGLTNIVLAIVLVPRFGVLGMAAAAVLAEVVVFAPLGLLYVRSER